MFRLPILFVLAGITGFMLYKNEQQRKPSNGENGDGEDNSEGNAPMLRDQPLPKAPVFDSDEEFSDSDASISDLDLPRN